MPKIETRTRVILVQNDHERTKPTNTGRLAHLMLSNSRLLRYAVRGQTFDPAPLCDPDTDYFLIFHRDEDQAELSPESLESGPDRERALVFLDGTWAQCSRMSHRVPGLERMRVLSLPPGPRSPWRVRAETHPDRMSTLEAIIRAVEIVEGAEPARQMRAWFYRVTAAMMYMKAMLPRPDMPDEWAALLGE
jgi:DTW domain-containing protein YfiP